MLVGIRTAGAVEVVGGILELGGVGFARWSAVTSPAASRPLHDIYNVIVMSPSSIAVGIATLILGCVAIFTARRL